MRNFIYSFKRMEGKRRIKINLNSIFLDGRKRRNFFSFERVFCDFNISILYIGR